MMPDQKLRLLFGTAALSRYPQEDREKYFQILEKHDVKDLDTAHIYHGSEEILSELNASSRFIIHTKADGFKDGALGKENLLKSGTNSHELLKEIETFYLHSPDHKTPLEETLSAVNSLKEHNVFKYFGLSNFTPEEVQEIHDICKSKSYVLPTVYQGNYNPLSRRQESTLFPVLRRLGIRFYAYSPIAGGFLAKQPENFNAAGQAPGRFNPNVSPASGIYNKLYNKPTLLKALSLWHEAAKAAQIPPAELAYRWVVYHSALDASLGDGVIIGASRPEQLSQTLEGIDKGPLSDATVGEVQKVWEVAKDDAPIDNFYTDK